jgi:hypothetical protein
MEIIVNGDPHIDGRQAMSDLLASDVEGALGHYGERITRIEATLTDANGANESDPADIHCTLETLLVGSDPVVVEDHAGTAHQAVEGALRKLERTLASALELHGPQHTPRSVNSTAVLDG